MQFQLVIQFEADSIEDFDNLVSVEDNLSSALKESACIDGHDFGQGEFNIFILTNTPEKSFREAASIIERLLPAKEFQAAYRDLEPETEDFTILWPLTLKTFNVA